MRLFFSIFLSICASLGAIAQDSLWVLVNIPVACIREDRSHASEMSSQAVTGTPMLILEDDGGEWLKLRGPEGYEGFMNISSVSRLTDSEMKEWRNAPRLTVVSMEEAKVVADTIDMSPRNSVASLVNGSLVRGVKSTGKYTKIFLPDGREGWIDTVDVMPIEQWASQPFDAEAILDRCYTLMGTPYLWGGSSTKSVDCSGLVRVAYYANGILTLRDARQQIEIGKRIEPTDTASLQPADLLFFSAEEDGRITHVAIYDRDRRYIHSSGRVKTNSMNPEDPDFGPRHYRGASRIDGMTGTPGIWQIIDHPWYFQK
ncbi:MAG: C40 family peptidase [Muribaculaceae bacterium]|nr:C40 family peptidase [Muribaculaceae bacterium]